MRKSLNDLLDAEPFVPFVIVMNSGDRYDVRNPGLVTPERDIINVLRERSNRRDVLRLAEICSIEVLDADPKP